MRKAKLLTTILAGGGDAVAPTVVITSSESTITASSPFSVTITFSEEVTGFAVGDITVGNGTAGNFATADNVVFTADITPTAAGTVTIDVAAGVCTDAAGNENEAATQFSILSTQTCVLWVDFSDLTTLFRDTGRATPVTADGQSILGITDKSGSANHLSQAAGGLYKVNIQNSLSAVLLNGTSQFYNSAADIISGGNWTMLMVGKANAGVIAYLAGRSSATSGWVGPIADGSSFNFYTDTIDTSAASIAPGVNTIWIAQYNSVGPTGRVRFNGSATWYSATLAAYVPYMDCFLARRNSGPFYGGYGFERLVFPSVLSDAVINLFRSYLNAKWSVF